MRGSSPNNGANETSRDQNNLHQSFESLSLHSFEEVKRAPQSLQSMSSFSQRSRQGQGNSNGFEIKANVEFSFIMQQPAQMASMNNSESSSSRRLMQQSMSSNQSANHRINMTFIGGSSSSQSQFLKSSGSASSHRPSLNPSLSSCSQNTPNSPQSTINRMNFDTAMRVRAAGDRRQSVAVVDGSRLAEEIKQVVFRGLQERRRSVGDIYEEESKISSESSGNIQFDIISRGMMEPQQNVQ